MDTSSGSRRQLLGQYDLVDRDEAERRILAAFEEVGFRELRPADPDGPVVLRRLDATEVRVTVPSCRRPTRGPWCGASSSWTSRWLRPGTPRSARTPSRPSGGRHEDTATPSIPPGAWPRPEVVLGWLIAAHVVLKLLIFRW